MTTTNNKNNSNNNNNNPSISLEDIDLYHPQPPNSKIFTRWVKGVKGALRSGKKRKSQKSNRREIFNLNSNKSDDSITSCLDNDCWEVDEEILNKDELITPDINSALFVEMRSDIYELSAVIPNSLPDNDHQKSQRVYSDSNVDYLENTRIIRGSEEHFAFVRTLRKLRDRKVRQRPIRQVLLLNKVLASLTFSQTSDKVHEELIRFKSRVYELNRIKRSNNKNKKNGRRSSSLSTTTTLSSSSSSRSRPSSTTNKKLSAILAEIHPTSPITMQYRPSYASSKVMTIFDEESNQLVTRDLPMARRRRRLSNTSSILVRSGSSSSTSSTNSSQSSLVTLADDIKQPEYSPFTTKEPDTTFIIVRQNDDEDGDEEDHVPLFVLKEQFKYSGRGCALLKNISTENVALAV